MDATALTRLWAEKWPECSKLPYEIRRERDRWVRFHALPGSKRYPGTALEYEIVLHRHNTVLTELATGSSEVLVMTAGYSESRSPERSVATAAAHPGAWHWTSTPIHESGQHLHLYVSRVRWNPGLVDPLLRLVADDVIADVLLTDAGLEWLYHPYDGGMDVVTSSIAARNALREHHRDWLPANPGASTPTR
ncbi:MAG TPA: hypothetical protein VN408_02395 [Actinoplanes sp.]|nr:hypothetical protein [Actinoplanes sp.]